jgi:serine/threonine-protein kinase
VDLSAVGAWADTAVAAGKLSPDLPWFQCCKGLAEYRQGHLAAAVDWMQKVLSHADGFNRDAAAYFVMAMAQYRSKQADEARAALARGVAIVEGKLPKLDSGDLGHWIDWIIAHALMREAKELIEGQTNTTAEKKPGLH